MRIARIVLVLVLSALASHAAHAQITLALAPPVSYVVGNQPRAVATSDFNGDGRLDLAVVNENAGGPGMVSILLAEGAPGTFGPATNYNVGTLPVRLVVADFNADGNRDLAVANELGGGVSILLGNGNGGFTAAASLALARASGLVAGDFNGDTRLDLAVTTGNAGTVSIHLGNGDGTFVPGQVLPGTGIMQAIESGDFNGDGRLDLAAADAISGSIHIYLGSGMGTFTSAGAVSASGAPTDLAVGDFNRDGRTDVAVSSSLNAVTILLGNGAGGFVAGNSLPVNFSPLGVEAADFDRDGRLDLVTVASASDRLDVFKGNSNGTFTEPPLRMTTGANPYLAAVADLDGDGRPDIVVANRGSDNVFVFLNTSAVLPTPPTAVIATAGGGQLSVAFTPPADAASHPILAYIAYCGTRVASGTTSPIVVTGLTNGVAYTCTMRARNATGTGAASAPSNSATPRAVSALAIASSASPVTLFASVTFTATVTGQAPTGTVNFRDGGVTIAGCGAVAIIAGSAQCVTSFATPGTRVVTAEYPGDAVNLPSLGTLAGGQVVTASTAVMALATSASPVPVGAPVTFTATVTGINPTGSVHFRDGGVTIAGCGAVALTAGSARCFTTFVTPGTKVITADYSGDGANLPATATLAGGQGVTAAQTSFTGPAATGTGNATVSFTGGGPTCSFAPQGNGPLQSAFFIPVSGHAKSPPAGSAPAGVAFPHGLLDFVLVNCTPGAAVTFTVTYGSAIPATAQYWKFGPTPVDPAPHWYTIAASVPGTSTVTFTITDGGLGDDDLAANGTVVDQGGPGVPPATEPRQVPTLSEWALLLLALIMAALGGRRLNPYRAGRSRR